MTQNLIPPKTFLKRQKANQTKKINYKQKINNKPKKIFTANVNMRSFYKELRHRQPTENWAVPTDKHGETKMTYKHRKMPSDFLKNINQNEMLIGGQRLTRVWGTGTQILHWERCKLAPHF